MAHPSETALSTGAALLKGTARSQRTALGPHKASAQTGGLILFSPEKLLLWVIKLRKRAAILG
jgi:hypothetical protein